MLTGAELQMENWYQRTNISRRQIEVDWQVNWTWGLHMIFYYEKKQRIEMNLKRNNEH